MRRTEARELLMQLIFQMEAQKDYSKEALITFKEENMDDSEQAVYFDSVMNAFMENKEVIDALIEESSNQWHLTRIAKVDLAVLRLCIAEMNYMTEGATPQSAAINEAVKLAKKFSGEDSGKFVNGVLGRIARQ